MYVELKKIKKGDVLFPPFNGYKKGIRCIYKINFKKGYFYIGSTVCLSTRLSGHKGSNSYQQSHPIKKIMEWKNVVSVEVLRTGRDVQKLRVIENKIINRIFKKYPCVNMTRKRINL